MAVSRSLLPLLLLLGVSAAQTPTSSTGKHRAVVEAAGRLMSELYVFADKGAACRDLLKKRLAEGAYDEIEEDAELARILTKDLRSLTNDLHVRVMVRPRPSRPERRPDPEEARARRLREAKRRNFGFERVERLDGNVGYLDLRGFASARYAGATAHAAMSFLANVDALIIDLRKNGGGSPTMIQLLSTYFFDEPTHLNSFFWRGKPQIDQFWTLPHVPGPRLTKTPLYILTSKRTFSAAEEFTYNLKHLKRATIIGETTGGGAHPGGTRRINDTFAIWIPRGRAINPITKTNWEGTGIQPHIPVPAEEALNRAHQEARKTLSKRG